MALISERIHQAPYSPNNPLHCPSYSSMVVVRVSLGVLVLCDRGELFFFGQGRVDRAVLLREQRGGEEGGDRLRQLSRPEGKATQAKAKLIIMSISTLLVRDSEEEAKKGRRRKRT